MHAPCVQADVAFWSSLVQYLNNAGEGADGKHNAISSFFMWAWDANADTEFGLGGLVDSGEPRKLVRLHCMHVCGMHEHLLTCQNRTSHRELPRTA